MSDSAPDNRDKAALDPSSKPASPNSEPDQPGEVHPEAAGEPADAAPEAIGDDSADTHAQGRPRRRSRRRGRGRHREQGAGEGPSSETPAAAEAAQPGSEQPASDSEAEAPGREPAERERPTAASVRDDGAPADIAPEKLDSDGIKILNRLHRYGHQAYFVGGCVRDLLLGRTPKDFDICTSAHPGEVRSLFRNCRLIGRRFRLAHVYFRGGKIIEVSTFRANPIELEEGEELPEDLLITRDNVFGTAEQDSRRRDFTVNGLFYDIRLGRVIDFVDGLADLNARTIRTIGNPEIRMREDPVRILPAVRFAARLSFDVDPATYAALEGAVEDLPRCAPARLLEEVFKLLRGGSSRRSLELLHALGALKVLLPPIGALLERTGPEGEREFFARLGVLDTKMPLDDSIIVAALLAPVAREDSDTAVDQGLEDMVQTARLPRRIADRARQLLWAHGVLVGEQRRKRSLASFKQHPIFPDAMVLLEIGVEATGERRELLERWKAGEPPAELGKEGTGKQRRRRRRKRGPRPPEPAEQAT